MSEVLFHAGDMKRIKRYGKALESTSHSNHLQKSLMFYTQNYSVPVSREDIDIATDMFTRKSEEHGCVPEFKDLMEIIIEEEGLQMPFNAREAKNLYITLLHHIIELSNQ